MLGSIGGPELILILVVVLLVFGPKRLPEFGRTIGKGLAEFKRASNDLRRSIEDEVHLDDSILRRDIELPQESRPKSEANTES